MKSIGKRNITMINTLVIDGQAPLVTTSTLNRVVYRNKAGEYFINVLGSKHKLETLMGEFIYRSGCAQVQALSGAEFLQGLAPEATNLLASMGVDSAFLERFKTLRKA